MLLHLLVVGFCASVLAGNSLGYHLDDPCANVVCRAGRECRVMEYNAPTCHCVDSCPDHHKPICGTNDVSYQNHCLLHRDACLTGKHVSIKHKGFCEQQEEHEKTEKKKEKPVVCFQYERDLYRQHIVDYFLSHQADQSWHREGMTYTESLWPRFYHCDDNKDTYVDSSEFLDCVRKNVSYTPRGDVNSQLVRALCMDAIVDSGDKNSDWRLDFEEFKTCMDPTFTAVQKKCSLEGKHYEDGAETKVDCNDCVCACGNWVCTSNSCEKTTTEEPEDETDADDDDDDDEDDDEYDDDTDDEDVRDDESDVFTDKEWKRLLRKLKKQAKL